METALEVVDCVEPVGLTYGSCVLDTGDEAPCCGLCGQRLELLGAYGLFPVWGPCPCEVIVRQPVYAYDVHAS